MFWLQNTSFWNNFGTILVYLPNKIMRLFNFAMAAAASLCAVLTITGLATALAESSPRQFPAIFNFGDSNSDTGAISAALDPLQPPYGNTFFGQPAGRYSDGRLIIDFFGS